MINDTDRQRLELAVVKFREIKQWRNVASLIERALEDSINGTAHDWFSDHAGEPIDTAQFNISEDQGFSGVWRPGPRVVSMRRSAVVFDGRSTLTLKGVRVASASNDALVTVKNWGPGVSRVGVYASFDLS